MSVSKQVKVETARLKAKLAVSLEAIQAISKLEGCGKIKSVDLRWDQYNTNYSAGSPPDTELIPAISVEFFSGDLVKDNKNED
jgi:hypothetical protein